MGAHESNSGLCTALQRMYRELGCLPAESEGECPGPTHVPFKRKNPSAHTCQELMGRLIARGCISESSSGHVATSCKVNSIQD